MESKFRRSDYFENTVAGVLKNCPPGVVFLAAVSGGADSTAMLAALAAIRGNEKSVEGESEGTAYSLRCVHVDHGIRPAEESGGDAEFTRLLCKKFRIPCRIVSVPPGKIEAAAKKFGSGIEASARSFRRRILFRQARRIETENGRLVFILTAHTKDDMLETVLMRILRGAGPAGLSAMPSNRGRFLRPMLELSRRDVVDYLSEKNIPWREDSTNADIRFFRNRVRHRLIPLLDESFPRWRKAVSSLAETQSLTADFIHDEAAARIYWQPSSKTPCFSVSSVRNIGEKVLFTDIDNFFAQPAIIREEALFQGVNKLGISGMIKRTNIRRFAEGKVTAVDLGPLRIQKDSQWIIIESSPSPRSLFPSPHEYGFSLLINTPGLYNLKVVTIEAISCCQYGDKTIAGFYAAFPLVLRPGLKDDCIETGGGTSSLQDVLKNGGYTARPRMFVSADGIIGTGSVISAVDRFGPAAFIGSGGLLVSRENTPALRKAGADIFFTVNPV